MPATALANCTADVIARLTKPDSNPANDADTVQVIVQDTCASLHTGSAQKQCPAGLTYVPANANVTLPNGADDFDAKCCVSVGYPAKWPPVLRPNCSVTALQPCLGVSAQCPAVDMAGAPHSDPLCAAANANSKLLAHSLHVSHLPLFCARQTPARLLQSASPCDVAIDLAVDPSSTVVGGGVDLTITM